MYSMYSPHCMYGREGGRGEGGREGEGGRKGGREGEREALHMILKIHGSTMYGSNYF